MGVHFQDTFDASSGVITPGVRGGLSMGRHLVLAVLAMVLLPPSAWGQTQIRKSVVAAGVNGASSSHHQISGTVGQGVVGSAEGAQFSAHSGFWFAGLGAPPSGVENAGLLPAVFRLHECSPNPIDGSGVIRFEFPVSVAAQVNVYDVSGRNVRRLVNASFPAGFHHAVWDAKDGAGRRVGAGVYFYQLRAGAFHSTKRVLVLR